MTNGNEPSWLFQDLGTRKVEVDFGGGLVLRELERHSGLFRALADGFVDHRDGRYIEHSLEERLARAHRGLGLGVRRPH
jgi:hypothetical protein